jgi:hypothetical protein
VGAEQADGNPAARSTNRDFQLSVPGVTVSAMEVTDADVAAIPARNVRVPRSEFVAVWRAASDRDHQDTSRGGEGWYAAGVAATCRWLATAPSRLANGLTDSTPAPATRRTAMAYEELIEAEWLAAARLEETLRWAWRRQGPPPLEVQVPIEK